MIQTLKIGDANNTSCEIPLIELNLIKYGSTLPGMSLVLVGNSQTRRIQWCTSPKKKRVLNSVSHLFVWMKLASDNAFLSILLSQEQQHISFFVLLFDFKEGSETFEISFITLWRSVSSFSITLMMEWHHAHHDSSNSFHASPHKSNIFSSHLM
jgi:hypothetical protein